jgi:hypothetical protein
MKRSPLIAKPTRRKRDRECRPHLEFVRSHQCSVKSWACRGSIEAHHIRTAANSGTGLKPPDWWTVPLCLIHHRELHATGQGEFNRVHGIDLAGIARFFAETSPFRSKFACNLIITPS